MKISFPALSLLTLLTGVMVLPSQSQAMMGAPLETANLSAAKRLEVELFVNNEIKADVKQNLHSRITQVSDQSTLQNHAMSRETQAVLLKGAYLTLMARSGMHLGEAAFNKNMGKVLDFLADYHAFPAAITIGILHRATIGEGIKVGANAGVEGNFYLQNGKLMMTNYALLGAQVGGAISALPAAEVTEFYVALCFGSCYGGDPTGWYVGFDGDVAAGLGGDFFVEIGVDVSAMIANFFGGHESYTLKDMYDAKAVYVGFGFQIGASLEASVAANLYYYSQLGKDTVLANPGQVITPQMMVSRKGFLKVP